MVDGVVCFYCKWLMVQCAFIASGRWCSVLLTHRGEGPAAGEVHVELVLQVDEGIVPGVGFRWNFG